MIKITMDTTCRKTLLKLFYSGAVQETANKIVFGNMTVYNCRIVKSAQNNQIGMNLSDIMTYHFSERCFRTVIVPKGCFCER